MKHLWKVSHLDVDNDDELDSFLLLANDDESAMIAAVSKLRARRAMVDWEKTYISVEELPSR